MVINQDCSSALSNLKMEASNSGANEGLLHDTEINKQKLMDAIHNDDVKTAKQLIGEGMDINFILDTNYQEMFALLSPLHAVLKLGSMDMLEALLSQPNIDLNISNKQLTAPLLWSLEPQLCYLALVGGLSVPEEFVLRLIRAGCDINRSDKYGETPLHLSVKYGIEGTTTITHELLKRGADINAQNSGNGTPLHHAVKKKDLELVCMLLYYNADVFIKNTEGHTPFSYALHLAHHEIAKVLSDYYSFLDDDVNYIINNYDIWKVFLEHTNAELFKAVWPRFDPELILCKDEFCCFLNCYICWCKYSTSDWVECLYLILNSDITIDCTCCDCLRALLSSMWSRHVPSEDRICLIYMMLSLGIEVTIDEFNFAVKTYGLNQDLEPFMHSTYSSITDSSKFVCPLHAFVIGLKTDFSVKKIIQLFHDVVDASYYLCYDFEPVLEDTLSKTVAFFSFSADAKNNLMSITDCRSSRGYNIVPIMDAERLQEIPEYPSLTELSRNQTHKYLVQKFRFKQPYQLQDFVKKLLISNKIKDIILFKEPIY